MPAFSTRTHPRLVELTIADHCRVRGWTLYTVNCRSNHGHVIVAGDREPKEIREPFKAGAPAGSRRCSRNVSVHSPHMIPRPRRCPQKWWAQRGTHSMSTTRKALRPSSTTYARHKIMQINLNPTSERGASRDAVNRPRETLGDSHLISSDPRSRFGLVCDLLRCRGNTGPRCRRAQGASSPLLTCWPVFTEASSTHWHAVPRRAGWWRRPPFSCPAESIDLKSKAGQTRDL